jgi:aspartate aminotransferase
VRPPPDLTVPPVVAPSATLAADERARAKIDADEPVVHLAFGEAGLPVLPSVRELLAEAGAENAYGPVAGSLAARTAAAGYFERRGLPTGPDQIVLAPGSKALLYALVRALPGDVVLPCPSWVSYAAQAALAGKRVWQVPIGEAGGMPEPAALEACLEEAAAAGGRPGILVVTLPDNPTGTLAGAALTREVAAIAGAHGVFVVSDEIYRDLAFEPGFVSPAELLPGQTFVTSGLSKSTALGGWRIGFARMPDSRAGEEARQAILGIASEIWSALAAPMQRIAAHVLAEPPEILERVERSRLLHRRVIGAAYGELVAAGASCRPPGGAFYLYPDFEPLRPQLAALGVSTADGLAELLLERFGIAVLSGVAFGDDPEGLRVRLASSLLYGRDDAERLAALASDDPAALPWIRSALDVLAGALEELREQRA